MAQTPPTGLGVDATGGPVIDPTANVIALVEAGMKRQDDLRNMEAAHVREVMALRAEHEAEMRAAEKQRVDAVRAVDVAASDRAAEALRSTVEATAKVTAEQIASILAVQYEQRGQRVGAVDTTAERRSSVTVVLLAVGLVFSALLSIAAIVAQLNG